MPVRSLSADMEKVVGMTRLQYGRRVRAGIVYLWTVLNEPG